MKLLGLIAGIVVVVLAAGVVATQLLPLPVPAMTVKVASTVVLDGSTPPPIPTPSQGSFALETTQDGELASRDADVSRPMASVAKTMTALAILDVHPLAGGAAGPALTVTAADVALYHQMVSEGASYAPVVLGETLTERDLLLGLMLPSANNFAVMAGQWIDGSESAFVARLNTMAKGLGMSHTTFFDPDGLSEQTVSTPDDLIKMGAAAINNPTLASIVTTSSAKLPDGSTITNIDAPLLATPGWLGIKTGHTNSAGYCLLFAAKRAPQASAPAVTVIGAVMDQPTRAASFAAADNAVTATFNGYAAVDLATVHPQTTGGVAAPWGSSSGVMTHAQTDLVVVRRGEQVELSFEPATAPDLTTSGASLGTIQGLVSGKQVSWDVLTTSPIGPPSRWWRVLHVR